MKQPILFMAFVLTILLIVLFMSLGGTVRAQGIITPAPVSIIPQPGTPVLSFAYTGNMGGTVFQIKAAGAGALQGWKFFDNSTGNCYAQFFQLPAASVTLGSTAPAFTDGTGTNQSGGMLPVTALLDGVNGLSVALTTTTNGSVACATGAPFIAWYSTR